MVDNSQTNPGASRRAKKHFRVVRVFGWAAAGSAAAEVCGRRRGFGYVSVGIPDRAQQYTGPDWTSEMSQTREARRRALAHEQARVGMAGAGDNIQPRRNPGLAMKKYRDEASPDRTGRRVDLWAHPKHGMDSVDSVGRSMGCTLRVFSHAPAADGPAQSELRHCGRNTI